MLKNNVKVNSIKYNFSKVKKFVILNITYINLC